MFKTFLKSGIADNKGSEMVTEPIRKSGAECNSGIEIAANCLTFKSKKGGGRQRIFLSICALLFVATAISGVFYGCKKDNVIEPSSKNQKTYYNPIHEEMRQHFCYGLILFKESLRPYYEQTQNYKEFCNSLSVDRQHIQPIGKGLLRLAYECLKKDYSDEYIKQYYTGKWMAEMFNGAEAIVRIQVNEISTYFGVMYEPNHPLTDQCHFILLDILQSLQEMQNIDFNYQIQQLCNTIERNHSNNWFLSEEKVQENISYFQKKYAIDIVEDVIFNDHFILTIEKMNCFSSSSGLKERLSSMDKTQLSAFVDELNIWSQAYSDLYNAGDINSPQFFDVSKNIFELAFPKMPLNDFWHDGIGMIVSFPIDYMTDIQDKLMFHQQGLFASYPQLENMSEKDYVSFLETAFYASSIYSETKLEMPPCNLPWVGEGLQDCINRAENIRTAAIVVATAIYVAGLATCVGGTAFIGTGGCILIAMAGYAVAFAEIQDSYSLRVQLCHKQ